MGPYDCPVFLKLGQGWLVRPYHDSIAVLPLLPGFLHTKQHVGVVVLSMNGIAHTRMASVDGPPGGS